eukprot:6955315-Pyramimonas_sp.AAC.1
MSCRNHMYISIIRCRRAALSATTFRQTLVSPSQSCVSRSACRPSQYLAPQVARARVARDGGRSAGR